MALIFLFSLLVYQVALWLSVASVYSYFLWRWRFIASILYAIIHPLWGFAVPVFVYNDVSVAALVVFVMCVGEHSHIQVTSENLMEKVGVFTFIVSQDECLLRPSFCCGKEVTGLVR
jgi:hypothetical protein